MLASTHRETPASAVRFGLMMCGMKIDKGEFSWDTGPTEFIQALFNDESLQLSDLAIGTQWPTSEAGLASGLYELHMIAKRWADPAMLEQDRASQNSDLLRDLSATIKQYLDATTPPSIPIGYRTGCMSGCAH